MIEHSVSDNKDILKEALAQKEYKKFFQRYQPHRYRIGVKMYEHLLEQTYKWETIQKINQMIDAFEGKFRDRPEVYMCIFGLSTRKLVYLAVDSDGYAIQYGDYKSKPGAVVKRMNSELGSNKPIFATEILGAFGSRDLRVTAWYKEYGRWHTVPMENSEKTTMTHMAGEPHVTVVSNERWAIEWAPKMSAKYGGIAIDHLDEDSVSARLPLEWMCVYCKDAPLPLGAGRLEKVPDTAITPPDGPCTVFEHTGGCGTAMAYVNEPWSRDLFNRYARMFVKSVREIASTGEGKAYYFPAGWMKLPPPSQRSRAIIRDVL